jgi:hypothetical protein
VGNDDAVLLVVPINVEHDITDIYTCVCVCVCVCVCKRKFPSVYVYIYGHFLMSFEGSIFRSTRIHQ